MKYGYLIFLLVFGCSTTVKTLSRPNYDISNYETWCWVKGCEIYYGNSQYFREELVSEISNAIAANMQKKGYRQSDETSDLLVNFYLTVREDSTHVINPYNAISGERDWVQEIYPEFRQLLKGSLVIDIIKRDSSELLWTSKVVKHFEPSQKMDKEAVWSAISKTMRKLPTRN